MTTVPNIERGIPVPQKKSLNPILTMLSVVEVGDSFHVEHEHVVNMRGFISRLKLYPDQHGKKFTGRKEGNGYRFWRVA